MGILPPKKLATRSYNRHLRVRMQQENLKTQGFGTFGLKTGEEKPALAFLVSELNFIRSYYH